jgi:hypothetical protein
MKTEDDIIQAWMIKAMHDLDTAKFQGMLFKYDILIR